MNTPATPPVTLAFGAGRKITGHYIDGLGPDQSRADQLNEQITITTADGFGPGGANHLYCLTGPLNQETGHCAMMANLCFQNGPVPVAGVNGVSLEAVLAVGIDRLEGFQYAKHPDGSFDKNTPGKFACPENADALAHLYAALDALKSRTRLRISRSVEGKLIP